MSFNQEQTIAFINQTVSQLEVANARIAELESQLAVANARIAELEATPNGSAALQEIMTIAESYFNGEAPAAEPTVEEPAVIETPTPTVSAPVLNIPTPTVSAPVEYEAPSAPVEDEYVTQQVSLINTEAQAEVRAEINAEVKAEEEYATQQMSLLGNNTAAPAETVTPTLNVPSAPVTEEEANPISESVESPKAKPTMLVRGDWNKYHKVSQKWVKLLTDVCDLVDKETDADLVVDSVGKTSKEKGRTYANAAKPMGRAKLEKYYNALIAKK